MSLPLSTLTPIRNRAVEGVHSHTDIPARSDGTRNHTRWWLRRRREAPRGEIAHKGPRYP